MDAEYILNIIENMIDEKNTTSKTKTKPDNSFKSYFQSIQKIPPNIKDLSEEVGELKKSTLYINKQYLEQIKQFNEAIKIIAPLIQSLTLSTKVINIWNVKAQNTYSILKKNGIGRLREARISTKSDFEIYLKSDDTDLFNIHSSFNELHELSLASDTIITKETPKSKTIVLKNISFSKSINLYITSNGTIDIANIFCIYDIRM